MIYGDFHVLRLIRHYRFCYITGRFGGGKTSLATYLSFKMMEKGWVDKIITNFPCAISTYPPPTPLKNASIVLDEAHEFVESWTNSKSYLKDLRKNNNAYFLPTAFSVHPRLRVLTITRFFNGYKTGLPMWVYRWTLNDTIKEVQTGLLYWWKPILDIDGLYSTDYVVNSDWGIGSALAGEVNPNYKRELGRIEEGKIEDMAHAIGDMQATLSTEKKDSRPQWMKIIGIK